LFCAIALENKHIVRARLKSVFMRYSYGIIKIRPLIS
jgi:hypothetical protein